MSKRRTKRIVLVVLFLILAAAVFLVIKNQYFQMMSIGTGSKAKILCSSVFLSGRDATAVEAEDLGFHPLYKIFKTKVDYEQKRVSCSLLGTGLFKAEAVFREGIGAVLLAGGALEEVVRAWPKPEIDAAVEETDPESVDWPMGDRLILVPPGTTIDAARIRAAGDRLFSEADPNHPLRTRALIVLHDGRLVYERYGPGITKNTRLLSWSTVKSVTCVLAGILVGRGRLDLDLPVPVEAWAGAGDSRRTITLDQLLRMSSGLEWFEAYADRPVSDVNDMLFRKPDMAAFAASKRRAVPAGAAWNYSSGTANIVQGILRKTLGSDEEYWNFPRRALLDRIGMRSAVMERDASGTFVGSSPRPGISPGSACSASTTASGWASGSFRKGGWLMRRRPLRPRPRGDTGRSSG